MDLTATISDPDAGDTVKSIQWQVTPTASLSAPSERTTQVQFSSAGTYTVSVAVKDSKDQEGTANITITVQNPPEPDPQPDPAPQPAPESDSQPNPDGQPDVEPQLPPAHGENLAPITKFALNKGGGAAPLTLTADASESIDQDGEIVSYTWTVTPEEGSTIAEPTADKTEIVLAMAGTYEIGITVEDDAGATESKSHSIMVRQGLTAGFKVIDAKTGGNAYQARQAITLNAAEDSVQGAAPITDFDWQITGGGHIGSLLISAFNQLPEPVAFNFWHNKFAEEGIEDVTAMAGAITDSLDFKKQYDDLADDEFISAIYQNTLGREPDTGERLEWVDKLTSGELTRAEFMVALIQSDAYAVIQPEPVTAEGLVAHVTVPEAGVYTVQLTLIDAEGNTDSAEREILVMAAPKPVAGFRVEPEIAEAGRPIMLRAADEDEDGQPLLSQQALPDAPLKYFDWEAKAETEEEWSEIGEGSALFHIFDEAGFYEIRLTVEDAVGSSAQAVASIEVTQAPSVGPGIAIVVAGGGKRGNSLFRYSDEAAQDTYRLLQFRGFTDDDIIYLNPIAPDIDLDKHPEEEKRDFDLYDADAEDQLQEAFEMATELLQPGQQFVFYWHGHAAPGSLDINGAYHLSAERLRELLDTLPEDIPQVVILDTCFSGSFLEPLANRQRERIVISSADDSSAAWSSTYGSFSSLLMGELRRNSTLGDAFEIAKRKLNRGPFSNRQSPWLDDDGDGVFSINRDGKQAKTIQVGWEGLTGANVAEIETVHPDLKVTGDSATETLWVTIGSDSSSIHRVLAVFIPPHLQTGTYEGADTDFGRIEKEMGYNANKDRFEVDFGRFCQDGVWQVQYEVQDNLGARSDPKFGTVTVSDIQDPICESGVSIELKLNATQFKAGNILDLEMEVDGEQEVVPYVAIILPEGLGFVTYSYEDSFSLPNTVHAFRSSIRIYGKKTYAVFSGFPLPHGLLAGTYQICGVLMPITGGNPLDANNWLDLSCTAFEYQ